MRNCIIIVLDFRSFLQASNTDGELRSFMSPPKNPKAVACESKKAEMFGRKTRADKDRRRKSDYTFECRFCKKSFTTSGHLQTHQRIHTRDRPFECRFCKKTFTQSGSLQKHERIHTGDRL